jgi:hypothetical protein
MLQSIDYTWHDGLESFSQRSSATEQLSEAKQAKDEGREWEWKVVKESVEELVEDHKCQKLHERCVQDVVEKQAQQLEEMEYQPTS